MSGEFAVELVKAEALPGRPLGKVVIKARTPEALEDLNAFRRHVGRTGGGRDLEVVFYPKREREPAGGG